MGVELVGEPIHDKINNQTIYTFVDSKGKTIEARAHYSGEKEMVDCLIDVLRHTK